jgi:hypothetical protein
MMSQMLRITILVVLVTTSVTTLAAQRPAFAELAADIGASYYHPDGLASIECGVRIDLAGLARQFGQIPVSSEPALTSTQIKVHADRGQSARVEVTWPDAPFPGNREQVEKGIQQMVDGFFQIYWQFFGSSLAPEPQDKLNVDERPGGGHVLHSTADTMNVTMETGTDHLPIRVRIDGPAIKIAADLGFSTPSVPGNLPQLTSVGLSEEIGTTAIKMQISTDYQTTNGFNIPRHVTMGIGGAISVPMELTGCSATAAHN